MIQLSNESESGKAEDVYGEEEEEPRGRIAIAPTHVAPVNKIASRLAVGLEAVKPLVGVDVALHEGLDCAVDAGSARVNTLEARRHVNEVLVLVRRAQRGHKPGHLGC